MPATTLPLSASSWRLDRETSLLAVLTHKGGFAAGLAHDHLVAATRYEARLELDPASPATALFELRVEAEGLEPDLAELQQEWYPRLAELGLLEEPFGSVSDKDRGKIRSAMLGGKQLDATRYPSISARLLRVREEASTAGEVSFTHQVTLQLEVRGRRVERSAAARYSLEDDLLTMEALGHFTFTEFGIKPYSAALGAVRNRDGFQVYVHLKARPATDTRVD